MSDMESISASVEAHAAKHNGYPRAADLTALAQAVDDEDLPTKDIWGNAYAYVVSSDARHYRIVSAGGDGIFDWDSRRVTETKPSDARYTDRLQDDLIYADGMWVQAPKVSRRAPPPQN